MASKTVLGGLFTGWMGFDKMWMDFWWVQWASNWSGWVWLGFGRVSSRFAKVLDGFWGGFDSVRIGCWFILNWFWTRFAWVLESVSDQFCLFAWKFWNGKLLDGIRIWFWIGLGVSAGWGLDLFWTSSGQVVDGFLTDWFWRDDAEGVCFVSRCLFVIFVCFCG